MTPKPLALAALAALLPLAAAAQAHVPPGPYKVIQTVKVGGDGNFIVGLRVKIATDVRWGGSVGTLSVVTLTTNTQESSTTTTGSMADPKKK